MNDRLRRSLRSILTQPFSATVTWDDLKQLLGALGAEVDERPEDRLYVRLNGRAASFRHADRTLPPEEVVLIKQFLEACGIASADLAL